MANRYDNTNMALPGVNRYAATGTSEQNRYASGGIPAPTGDGFFRRTIVGFGGAVGKAGQLLQTGQFAQVGATEKLLETTGLLKKTDISGTGIYAGIKEQKSNIGLLRRIG